jgi:hypothetical protein
MMYWRVVYVIPWNDAYVFCPGFENGLQRLRFDSKHHAQCKG